MILLVRCFLIAFLFAHFLFFCRFFVLLCVSTCWILTSSSLSFNSLSTNDLSSENTGQPTADVFGIFVDFRLATITGCDVPFSHSIGDASVAISFLFAIRLNNVFRSLLFVNGKKNYFISPVRFILLDKNTYVSASAESSRMIVWFFASVTASPLIDTFLLIEFEVSSSYCNAAFVLDDDSSITFIDNLCLKWASVAAQILRKSTNSFILSSQLRHIFVVSLSFRSTWEWIKRDQELVFHSSRPKMSRRTYPNANTSEDFFAQYIWIPRFVVRIIFQNVYSTIAMESAQSAFWKQI